MSRINKTLLEKLFLKPNPQPDRPEVLKLYNLLSYRMFPGKQDFINFLKTQSIDKQYEYAARSIHRLCYISNFPPSYFAMKDVLSIETYQKRAYSDTDDYIPRDHFIHLINIYLLGIYIFFYNNEIYDRILKDNQFERAEELVFFPHLNEIKDFISEWRYFSLYHDIGYVPEIFGNDRKVTNPTETYNMLVNNTNDFQSSLLDSVPIRHEAFFSTLEIMSRILVAKYVLNNSVTEIRIDNKFFKSFKNDSITEIKNGDLRRIFDFEEEYTSLFKDTCILEKIYSNTCLKPLLPIFNANNIIVLGVHKKTGKLAYISYPEGKQRILVVRNAFIDHMEVVELKKRPQIILYDEYQSESFEIDYILRKDKAKSDLYDNVMFDETNLEHTYLLTEHELTIKYSEISNEEQFLDFFFEVYYYLYNKLRVYIAPGKAFRGTVQRKEFVDFLEKWKCNFNKNESKWLSDISALQSIIYKVVQRSFSSDIEKSCVNYIKNLKIDIPETIGTTGDIKNDIDKKVDIYLEEIKRIIEDTKKTEELKSDIRIKYSLQMERLSSLLKMYSVIYAGIKTVFSKDGYKFSYAFDYMRRKSDINHSFCKKYVDLKTQKEGTYETIINDYQYRFGNTINHGFASAQYAAAVFGFLRHSFDSEGKNDGEWKLIDILFGISNPEKNEDYKSKYIYNYEHIFKNVLYAIIIHNVSPNHFKKNSELFNMKISISDPFSYLAILTDELQEWNRPQMLSFTLLDVRPNEHASDHYNIDVNNSGIYLYEEGNEAGQKRLERKIEKMTRLKDIKAFLKNGYVQSDT